MSEHLSSQIEEHAQSILRLVSDVRRLELKLDAESEDAEITHARLDKLQDILNNHHRNGTIDEIEKCAICSDGYIEMGCLFCPRVMFCTPCFDKLEQREIKCPFCNRC